MKVGTKSILFGVHQFLIHPWFVAYGWYKFYGFPWKIQYWFAFFLHDIGYWGKFNMDGPEGETHVELGAYIIHRLFDKKCARCYGDDRRKVYHFGKWYDFTLFHSRFYAKKMGAQYSKLCVADKYSFIITPKWLYKILSYTSGEIYEYLNYNKEKYKYEERDYSNFDNWHKSATKYITEWCNQHKNATNSV